MPDGKTYEAYILLEDGTQYATEFANHHADALHDMGFEAVFFERTGDTWLLREVSDE